jgi:hypothetical protein
MAYVHTLQQRYDEAQRFITRWAGHEQNCTVHGDSAKCTCGFYEALGEFNHYCTDQHPKPEMQKLTLPKME